MDSTVRETGRPCATFCYSAPLSEDEDGDVSAGNRPEDTWLRGCVVIVHGVLLGFAAIVSSFGVLGY